MHSDPLAEQHAIEDAQQAAWELRYYTQLDRHPHCDDPDHPGCAECEQEDE
jgi:hypothetical protein